MSSNHMVVSLLIGMFVMSMCSENKVLMRRKRITKVDVAEKGPLRVGGDSVEKDKALLHPETWAHSGSIELDSDGSTSPPQHRAKVIDHLSADSDDVAMQATRTLLQRRQDPVPQSTVDSDTAQNETHDSVDQSIRFKFVASSAVEDGRIRNTHHGLCLGAKPVFELLEVQDLSWAGVPVVANKLEIADCDNSGGERESDFLWEYDPGLMQVRLLDFDRHVCLQGNPGNSSVFAGSCVDSAKGRQTTHAEDYKHQQWERVDNSDNDDAAAQLHIKMNHSDHCLSIEGVNVIKLAACDMADVDQNWGVIKYEPIRAEMPGKGSMLQRKQRVRSKMNTE